MSDTFDPGRALALVESCTDAGHHVAYGRGFVHEMAGLLRAAVAEVEEARIDRKQLGEILSKTNEALNRAGCYSALYYWEHIDNIAADRDRLAARVAELEKLAGEACGELEAASRWIGSTQYRVDDATHKQFAAHVAETASELRQRLGGK
jgi:hypothetical protein